MFFADDRHNPDDGVQTTSILQQNDAVIQRHTLFIYTTAMEHIRVRSLPGIR